MADPSPPRDGLGQLADAIGRLSARVDALESPSGTQQYNAVPALQAAVALLQEQQATIIAQQEIIVDLVDGLDARVTDFIDTNIDGIVEAKVDEKLAGPDITIGQAGGTVKIPAALTTDLTSTSGRFVAWIGGDNRIGHT